MGNPYGGVFSLRYFLLSHLSVEASVGYLVGYQTQRIAFAYVSYRRDVSTALSPINAGVNLEILPHSRFNPYVGIAGGVNYLVVRQDSEHVRSGLPLNHGELSLEVHRLLPTVIGKAGMDVRLNEFFGVGAAVLYSYCPATHYRIEIPGASRDEEIRLSQVLFTLGISVYY